MIRIVLRLLIVAVLAGAVVYWVRFVPLTVGVSVAGRGPVRSEVPGTGHLIARTKATISAKIQGRLVEVSVDQNDRVTTGQLLARLDDSDVKQQVGVAKANLEAARATVDRATADSRRTDAVIQLAQLEFNRYEKLSGSQSVSVSDVDDRRERLQVAEAEKVSAEAAIAEARKQVSAAERNLDYQDARLSDTLILSPFAGLITRRDRDVGDIIVPGTSIFQLVSLDDIWVAAWVEESFAAKLAPGQEARVVFRSEPDREYGARVERIGRETDRETREFVVDIQAEALPANWSIGQRAEVWVTTGATTDTVRIPFRQVSWREGKPGVFVASGGKAVWRTMELGMSNREFVAVVAGLEAGDRVIVGPEKVLPNLSPGRRIRVKQ
jgi:HlyD family secretion protein